jgi:manganese efflux pump family protein
MTDRIQPNPAARPVPRVAGHRFAVSSRSAIDRRRVPGRLARVGAAAGLLTAITAAAISLAHQLTVRADDTMLKTLGVALAVGLDVLALSIAVGLTGIPWRSRIRLGAAFSTAEVVMQILGYALGSGVGQLLGMIAVYAGFAVLGLVGVYMIRESLVPGDEAPFKVDTGWGLLAASASISLDSLGVGVALPGVPLPLLPLLGTVACSTVLFTFLGLAFGARLGARFEKGAERVAGIVLIGLAVLFTAEHIAR